MPDTKTPAMAIVMPRGNSTLTGRTRKETVSVGVQTAANGVYSDDYVKIPKGN